MNKAVVSALTYLLVAILGSFVLYLVKPLFPSISANLNRISENLASSLGLDISSQHMSLILALLVFICLYSILARFVTTVRNKTLSTRTKIDPGTRYRSAHFSFVKTLFVIVFIPLIYVYGQSLVTVVQGLNLANERVIYFGAGFAAYVVVWLLFLRLFRFLSIFEHEFTHMIVAMCFFHRPRAFYVNEYEGGWVKVAGTNFVITLAPYFLLTFCFLMMPLYLVIKPQFYTAYFAVMGFFLGYHTLSTIRETNFNRQPDIIVTGKLFSLFVIVLGNILCYGYVLAFVAGGFEGGAEFVRGGWRILMEQAAFLGNI